MPAIFGGQGSVNGGTGSITPGYPTVAAGDLMILTVANKYPTNGPTTPTGWTLINQATGGNGASGVDTGSVYVTAYAKIADGTESGTLTVTIPSGNSSIGRIFYFTKATDEAFQGIPSVTVAHNTPGTSISAAASTRMNVKTKDRIFIVSGFNTDAFTYSNQSVSMANATFDSFSEKWDGGAAAGDDIGVMVFAARVASGDTTGFLNYSFDASGSTANSPAGASIIMRMRASASVTNDNASRRRYIVTRINKQSPRMENILEDLYEPRRGSS